MRSLLIFLAFHLSAMEEVYLKAPNLSRENIIGTNVGIRPTRKSGIRIETETFGDKLLIHNYGYEGSGVTLCWGGSHEVMKLLKGVDRTTPVAILGAGVIGLAVAYDLLYKGYDVRIYADAFSPHLTSDVAAGIWSPPKHKKDEYLTALSEKRFFGSISNRAEFAGVRMMDCYSFRTSSGAGAVSKRYQEFEAKGQSVIVHFDNGVTKKGKRMKEMHIDGHLFIADLFSKVKQKGARLIERHFESQEQILALEEPTIINCTSLGSRALFNDNDFTPVRGQMVYFKKHDYDYLIFQNVPTDPHIWVSIYPWSDRIVLGGVYEVGQEEAITDPHTIDAIINNAHKCLNGTLELQ